ncbi:MAG: flagellar protein FlaG [Planctomycetes bacterium]|nr:flagellar protein FlaG [Planctomycetota bacterium]
MELNSIRVVQGAALKHPGSAEAEALDHLAQANQAARFQDAVHPGTGVLEPGAIAQARETVRTPPRTTEERAGREGRVVEVGGFLLSFRIDGEGGRPVAELLDPETRQVIREIPSEELRDLSQALAEYSGNFVDREG